MNGFEAILQLLYITSYYKQLSVDIKMYKFKIKPSRLTKLTGRGVFGY